MKRIIALISFVALALAQTALAQETIPVKNKQVVGIVYLLGVGLADTKIVFDDVMPSTLIWSGALDMSNPEESLDTVLKSTGFAARRNGDVIHIYRVGVSTATAMAQSDGASHLGEGRPEPQFHIPPRQDIPNQGFHDSQLGEGRIDPRFHIPAGYAPYGAGYGYNNGYMDPAYQATALRVQGLATTGWLKFYTNGDTAFSTHLVVLRKVGATYTPVCAGGKSFRIFHDPCEVPTGLSTYRFELRGGGKSRFYEEDIEIFSRFSRDKPLQYPINQEMFDSWQKAEGMKRVETWK